MRVFIDGSSDAEGFGGWACIIELPTGQHQEVSGGEKETTNNRMELQAAIQALRNVHPDEGYIIYSDSQYVVNGITQWVHRWKQAGWKKLNGSGSDALCNLDLWKELYHEFYMTHQGKTQMLWCKGHNGNQMNEWVDSLASNARNLMRKYAGLSSVIKKNAPKKYEKGAELEKRIEVLEEELAAIKAFLVI